MNVQLLIEIMEVGVVTSFSSLQFANDWQRYLNFNQTAAFKKAFVDFSHREALIDASKSLSLIGIFIVHHETYASSSPSICLSLIQHWMWLSSQNRSQPLESLFSSAVSHFRREASMKDSSKTRFSQDERFCRQLDVTESVILICFNDMHSLNDLISIDVSDDEKSNVTFSREVHFAKHDESIFVNVDESWTCVSEVRIVNEIINIEFDDLHSERQNIYYDGI